MQKISLLLAVTLFAVSCGSSSSDSNSSSSNSYGNEIVFVSDRDGDDEIFVMNADGTGVRQLTNNDEQSQYPAWSPASNEIVFVSDYDIFVMNADGTGVRQLTNTPKREYQTSWSPDGSQIVFASHHTGSDSEIYVMNADGTEVRQLTDYDKSDTGPSWSPDGNEIAFVSTRFPPPEEATSLSDLGGTFGDTGIYVMNADGTEVRVITEDAKFPYDDKGPSWSPDGSQIAFESNSDSSFEIFVINASGSRARQLTYNDNYDGYPTWSPDGSQIAFESNRNGDYEIFVMNADGSEVYSTGQQGDMPNWKN